MLCINQLMKMWLKGLPELYPIFPLEAIVQYLLTHRSQWRSTTGVCVLVAQSFPTLCNSMDCSPPGSSVLGILQARIREWVAIPFSRGSSWPRYWTWVSCIAGRFFTIWASRFLWISTMKKPRKLKELIEILVKNVADNSYRGKSEWPRNRWRDIEITWNRDLRKRKMIPADYGGYRG